MYKYFSVYSRAFAATVCLLCTSNCKKNQPPQAAPANSSASTVASASPSFAAPERPSIVRISAFHDGSLQLDGAKMSEAELINVLSALDPSRTIIWYYREAAKEAPHPSVQRVVQAIADFGFPISLSTQPDFSDVVGDDQKTRPRVAR